MYIHKHTCIFPMNHLSSCCIYNALLTLWRVNGHQPKGTGVAIKLTSHHYSLNWGYLYRNRWKNKAWVAPLPPFCVPKYEGCSTCLAALSLHNEQAPDLSGKLSRGGILLVKICPRDTMPGGPELRLWGYAKTFLPLNIGDEGANWARAITPILVYGS